MKRLFLLIALMTMTTFVSAQRFTDKLDRGLVAVPSRTSGNFVSWRVFGEEYYDVTYNLYANGTKIASNLSKSNFNHDGGNANTKYQVAAVVRGVEQEKCPAITSWSAGYKQVNLIEPVDRDGNAAGGYYAVNDISLGDLNGDGVCEFIIKRPCSDASDISQNIRFHHLDCYDINGNRLWWIDLGPNMLSGPDEQWDCICNDWDRDGKAEVLLRIQDNAYIHYADGTSQLIGSSTVDTRWNGIEYTSSGNEYLIYLEGATGKPYEIGPSSHPLWMDYPLERVSDDWWGTGIVGHRSTKHYWGAPFLDGRHASIFLGRGCYTKHKFTAFDVDPATHKLSQTWYLEFTNSNSPWYANGYHNFAVGDVDWDGRDEIIFGSMVIDDNGKGLSTTAFGHGDAQHCSDFDPYRHGAEQFACLEEGKGNFGCNYRNATTGEIYVKIDASGDDGRALMGNFVNDYPGSFGRSVSSGWISSVADKVISGMDLMDWSDLNWRIYWDGDLCDEYMDSPGTARAAVVYKPVTGSRLVQCVGSLANSSKNNPGAAGDILGDWREELVLRYGDNAFVIYTTNYPTNYRIPTLWHDHHYRNAMVWQTMGYNQPPHKSYFLGELEGITVAPPPYTMTGRTEVKNGGTITTTDDHLLVCEFADTKINIADGANPYMVTFNVPSLVEGTAASNTTVKKTPINTSYYKCDVSGGSLTGKTRVVKQGDGILTLPAVDMTYSGETNIWAGTVNFNGSAANSNIWLNRFGELNSNAAEATFKSLKADYASVVRPGGENNIGTITADSIYYMGFGSRLVLDLYSDGFKADQIKTKKLTIQKKNWEYGPRYLMPVIEIKEHYAEGASTLEPGKYLIGNIGELSGSLTNIKIEGLKSLKSAFERDAEGNLYLVLGAMRGASSIVWTGSSSGVWDYATSSNFYIEGDSEQTPDIFAEGDIVYFNDEAKNFNVTLKDGDVLPADTIFVNNTKTYTFGGTGTITSGASLVKEGSGILSISNENTYTGGNYLKGGVVRVSALSNSSQAYGNLGAVTATTGKFTMENGAELNTTAEVKMGSPIKFIGDGGVINNQKGFTMEKNFSGTSMTKKGAGTLNMNGTLNTGSLTVQAGTFNYSTAQYGKTVYLKGTGNIAGNGFQSCPIVVDGNANATFTLTSTYYAAHANKISGGGTLTIKPTNTVQRVRITGDWSAFKGTIKHTTSNITLPLDNSYGIPNGTLDIAENCNVNNVCHPYHVGKLTGKGTLLGPGPDFQSQNGVTGTNFWIAGNDTLGNFTFEGKLSDNGGTNVAHFEKTGTCKMTVAGVWTNNGTIRITGGELFTRSGSCLGKGSLTVSKDAKLTGLGSLTNASYTINGTVQPGLLATIPTGAIDFGGKNVTVNATGVIKVTASSCATELITATTNGCSTLLNINKMTCNGTVEVSVTATNTLQVGDSIRIWVANTNSGKPNLASKIIDSAKGLYWDDSRLNEGLLFVTDQYDGVIGDVDNDGQVNISDVVKVINMIAAGEYSATADLNNDGQINITDIVKIINIIAGIKDN